MWSINKTVVPVLIRALGTVSNNLGEGLEELEITKYRDHADDSIAENGENRKRTGV